MEKHRIKVRITRPDQSRARLAFEIDPLGSFSVHAHSQGFEGLGGSGKYFKIFVEDYVITLETPDGQKRPAQVGMTFQAGNGKIEFLEVPVLPRPPVEESTRSVAIDPATRMIQRAELKREKESAPASPQTPAEASAEAAPQAPAMVSGELPMFEVDLERSHRPVPPASVAQIILEPAPQAQALPTSPALTAVEAPVASSQNVPSTAPAREPAAAAVLAGAEPPKHPLAAWLERPQVAFALTWVATLLFLGSFAELGTRVVVWANPLITPLPTGIGAVGGWVVGLGLALGTWLAQGRLGFPAISFGEVFRTFAMGALLIPIWALSFAYPPIVGLLAALLVAAAWTFLFQIRYGLSDLSQLSSLSLVLWTVLMGAGYGLRQTAPQPEPTVIAAAPQPQIAARTEGQAVPIERQPASQPTESAPASPELTAMMRKLRGVASVSVDEIANAQFFAAIGRGDLPEVKRLVRLGKVDPLLALDGGNTALHRAAASGQLEIVKYLLSRKISIDARDSAGSTALIWAVFRKHREVVRYLLKKGADPSIRNDAGDIAFDIASRSDDVETLRLLREASSRRPGR